MYLQCQSQLRYHHTLREVFDAAIWREDTEVNRNWRYLFALPSDSISLILNLLPKQSEVCELLLGMMEELCILLCSFLRLVQLQHQRTPRNDTGSSRKKVSTNYTLNNRRFSRTLTTDDGDSRKSFPERIERVVTSSTKTSRAY